MKKNYLITIIVLVLFFLVSACSSQVDTQKQKKQALAKTGISESDSIDSDMDSSKNLRLWVWSELGSNQAEPEIKEIIRDNKIIAQTVYGSDDLAVLYDSFLMVEIDLAGIGKDPSELSVEWILQPQNDEPRIILSDPVQKSVRSQGFNIDFTSRFKVSINIIESESIAASQQHSFSVISPPSIKIVQPTSDIIIKYGDSVKFLANAVDGSGNFPVVIWVNKSNNIERLLGVGTEIDTNRLDIGYNSVTAYAVDNKGITMHTKPIHVIVPYQAVKTKIDMPKNEQTFEWNQPIVFFAKGNELEYSLTNLEDSDDEPSFTAGSGFLVNSLDSGNYRIAFRGKFGSASHLFTVKEKLKDIAQVTRVEGYVLMSGKQGDWQRVKTGDNIPEGYIVRTVDDGLAEIHLANGVIYILNQENSIRILPNGNIVKNLNREDLALYSLVDPENIEEVQKNLAPMIGQLQQLLKNHEIVELEAENKQDILLLLDLIFKGQLKIDEVTIE